MFRCAHRFLFFFFFLHVWTFACLCHTALCLFVKMWYLCVCVDTDSNWILMRGPPTPLSHDCRGWVALQRGRHCISGRERTTLFLCCSRKQSLARKEGNVLCVWQYSPPKYKCCNMPKQAAVEDTLLLGSRFYILDIQFHQIISAIKPFRFKICSFTAVMNHSVQPRWKFAWGTCVQLSFMQCECETESSFPLWDTKKTWDGLKNIRCSHNLCEPMWSYNIAAAPPYWRSPANHRPLCEDSIWRFSSTVVLLGNHHRHISGRSCVDGSSRKRQREKGRAGGQR